MKARSRLLRMSLNGTSKSIESPAFETVASMLAAQT